MCSRPPPALMPGEKVCKIESEIDLHQRPPLSPYVRQVILLFQIKSLLSKHLAPIISDLAANLYCPSYIPFYKARQLLVRTVDCKKKSQIIFDKNEPLHTAPWVTLSSHYFSSEEPPVGAHHLCQVQQRRDKETRRQYSFIPELCTVIGPEYPCHQLGFQRKQNINVTSIFSQNMECGGCSLQQAQQTCNCCGVQDISRILQLNKTKTLQILYLRFGVFIQIVTLLSGPYILLPSIGILNIFVV